MRLPRPKSKLRIKRTDSQRNLLYPSQLDWQKSTDLTWLNPYDKLNHLHQHMALNFKERKFYKDFRAENWRDDYCYFNGVAQGSPLSPTLATTILIPALMLAKEACNIFYADDGALYSDNKFDPDKIFGNIDRNSGISVHPQGPKSGWVKYDGVWKKEFKFLGKKFVPESLSGTRGVSILSNATRTPKPFTFDRNKIFGWAIEYDYWKKTKGKILPDSSNSYVRNISES